MEPLRAEDLRPLLIRIQSLAVASRERRTAGDHLGDRVDALLATSLAGLPLTDNGDLDEARWASLDNDSRRDILQLLLRLRDSLEVLTAGDGPSDPRSFMYRDYVSNRGVVALTLFALIGTLALLVAIYLNWTKATSYTGPQKAGQQQSASAASSGSGANASVAGTTVPNGPEEKDVLLMVILMGSLGGFIHCTSSLTKYIGNRQFIRSWIVYYLLMPLEGSGLAITVYLMVRVGVLNPAATNADATRSLNWVGIYALAALAGLFSKQALTLLGDVFATIFRRVEAKDSGAGKGPSADRQ